MFGQPRGMLRCERCVTASPVGKANLTGTQPLQAWFTGLRVVADRLRVTGTPAVPAAAAFAAAQLGTGGGFPPAILSSAELARCYGGGTAVVSRRGASFRGASRVS